MVNYCITHRAKYCRTSNDGKNLPSISTAPTCLAPARNKERVSEPGPAPTSHTSQSNTSETRAILSEIMFQNHIVWYSSIERYISHFPYFTFAFSEDRMIVITLNYKFVGNKISRGLQAGVPYHTGNIEIKNKILAELFLGWKSVDPKDIGDLRHWRKAKRKRICRHYEICYNYKRNRSTAMLNTLIILLKMNTPTSLSRWQFLLTNARTCFCHSLLI